MTAAIAGDAAAQGRSPATAKDARPDSVRSRACEHGIEVSAGFACTRCRAKTMAKTCKRCGRATADRRAYCSHGCEVADALEELNRNRAEE